MRAEGGVCGRSPSRGESAEGKTVPLFEETEQVHPAVELAEKPSGSFGVDGLAGVRAVPALRGHGFGDGSGEGRVVGDAPGQQEQEGDLSRGTLGTIGGK